MLKIFRLTALLEGISYLALFGFSMPLKYWADLPEYNIYVGYIHGFLFLAYIALAIVVFVDRNWQWGRLVKILLASILPFGTLYIDQYLLLPVLRSDKASQG